MLGLLYRTGTNVTPSRERASFVFTQFVQPITGEEPNPMQSKSHLPSVLLFQHLRTLRAVRVSSLLVI